MISELSARTRNHIISAGMYVSMPLSVFLALDIIDYIFQHGGTTYSNLPLSASFVPITIGLLIIEFGLIIVSIILASKSKTTYDRYKIVHKHKTVHKVSQTPTYELSICVGISLAVSVSFAFAGMLLVHYLGLQAINYVQTYKAIFATIGTISISFLIASIGLFVVLMYLTYFKPK